MSELWLPVVGWEGLYEVSDLGRVRSLTRLVEMPDTRWGGTRKRVFPGKIRALQWTTPKHGGKPYLVVSLKEPGRASCCKVHRLVLQAFIGSCLENCEGAHKDGGTSNNRLANLSWKTPVENSADKVRHGTNNFGITWPKSSPAIQRAIRKAVAAGASQRSQCRKYGLSDGYVCQLVNRTGKYTKGRASL